MTCVWPSQQETHHRQAWPHYAPLPMHACIRTQRSKPTDSLRSMHGIVLPRRMRTDWTFERCSVAWCRARRTCNC